MALLKQSTAYTRAFLMVDSADHITGKTGLTVAVTLSKAGAAFGAAGGAVSEISSGWYKVALSTTDTNTVGDLAVHATSAGADPTDFADQVTAGDLANLDAPISGVPTATQNADALLKRDWTSVTGEAARSALNALRAIRNKVTLPAGGVLTVFKEDGTTTAWVGNVTTDVAALPVTGDAPTT